MGSSLARLVRFLSEAMEEGGHRVRHVEDALYEIEFSDGRRMRFTTDRETGKDCPDLELLGLDHPVIQDLLSRFKRVPADALGVSVRAEHVAPGVVSLWNVGIHGKSGERRSSVQVVAADREGQRLPHLERVVERLFQLPSAEATLSLDTRLAVLKHELEPMLHRDLRHKGIVVEGMGFSAELIGWLEVGTDDCR